MPFLVDRERDTQVAERVRVWLAGQTIDDLRPTRVERRRQEDASGEDAWFFVVELPDPDPDAGTWPVETLNEFARTTRDKAIEEGLSWPWYVVFFPESEEEQEDEDQLQLPDV
jgi:hypothetical protein